MCTESHEFESIYRENYANLYKVAYRITGSPHDAEDALQEAYLKAFTAYGGFKGLSAVSTWLYRITVNSALRYIKYRKSFPVERLAAEKGVTTAAFFEGLKDYRQVEDEVLYNDMRETCIQMFMECLPKKQRLTFILKAVMGLSVAEVAEILDISPSAVKTNLFRARKTMTSAMEGKCSFINPDYPCQCKLWVNYAIENNKRELIRSAPVAERDLESLTRQITGEMNILKKLSILYDSDYRPEQVQTFLDRMKAMVAHEELRIFQ